MTCSGKSTAGRPRFFALPPFSPPTRRAHILKDFMSDFSSRPLQHSSVWPRPVVAGHRSIMRPLARAVRASMIAGPAACGVGVGAAVRAVASCAVAFRAALGASCGSSCAGAASCAAACAGGASSMGAASCGAACAGAASCAASSAGAASCGAACAGVPSCGSACVGVAHIASGSAGSHRRRWVQGEVLVPSAEVRSSDATSSDATSSDDCLPSTLYLTLSFPHPLKVRDFSPG